MECNMEIPSDSKPIGFVVESSKPHVNDENGINVNGGGNGVPPGNPLEPSPDPVAPPPPALPVDEVAPANPVQKKLEALQRLKSLKFNSGGLKTDLSNKPTLSIPFNYEPVRKHAKLDLMALQGAIASNSQLSPDTRRKNHPYKSFDEPAQDDNEVDLLDNLYHSLPVNASRNFPQRLLDAHQQRPYDTNQRNKRPQSQDPFIQNHQNGGYDAGRLAAGGGIDVGRRSPVPLLGLNLSPQPIHNYRDVSSPSAGYDNLSPSRPRYSQPVIERYRGRPRWFDMETVIEDQAPIDTAIFDRWSLKGLKDLVEDLAKKEGSLVEDWKKNDQEVCDLQEILARELRELDGCRRRIDEQTRESIFRDRESKIEERTAQNINESNSTPMDSGIGSIASSKPSDIRPKFIQAPPPISTGIRFPSDGLGQMPGPGQLMALINARLAAPMKKKPPEPGLVGHFVPSNVQLPFAPRPPPPNDDVPVSRPSGPPPMLHPPRGPPPPMRPGMPPPTPNTGIPPPTPNTGIPPPTPNTGIPPPGPPPGIPPTSIPPPGHSPGMTLPAPNTSVPPPGTNPPGMPPGPNFFGPPPGPGRLLPPRFRMPLNVRIMRPGAMAQHMKHMKMMREREKRGPRHRFSPPPLTYAVPLTPEYEGNEEGDEQQHVLEDVNSPGEEEDEANDNDQFYGPIEEQSLVHEPEQERQEREEMNNLEEDNDKDNSGVEVREEIPMQQDYIEAEDSTMIEVKSNELEGVATEETSAEEEVNCDAKIEDDHMENVMDDDKSESAETEVVCEVEREWNPPIVRDSPPLCDNEGEQIRKNTFDGEETVEDEEEEKG